MGAQRDERGREVEADVHREGARLRGLRARGRAPPGRAARKSTASRQDSRPRARQPGLAAVADRARPQLAREGVVGEPLDLLADVPLRVEALHGLGDARVQRAPALVEQARVGDVVDERVPERVHGIGKERGLGEELGPAEAGEPVAHRLGGRVRHRLEQRHRHLLADHRGGLEQVLLVGRQPVDARGEHGPDAGRHLERARRRAPPGRRPASPASTPVSTRLRTRFLEEERVAAGALGDEAADRRGLLRAAEQTVEQRARARPGAGARARMRV